MDKCQACQSYRLLDEDGICERCRSLGANSYESFRILLDRLQVGVSRPYTELQLSTRLDELTQHGLSLREIAKYEFHGKVTHGTVQRALKGEFPKDRKLRRAMGLSDLVPTPACSQCGEVHDVPWCIYEAEVEMLKPINGHIPQGSQVYDYKICECGQPFVPNTPLRKKCYTCSVPVKMKRSE